MEPKVLHNPNKELCGIRKEYVIWRQPSRRFSASATTRSMIWFFIYRSTFGSHQQHNTEVNSRFKLIALDTHRTSKWCCKTQYQMAFFSEAPLDWKKTYRTQAAHRRAHDCATKHKGSHHVQSSIT